MRTVRLIAVSLALVALNVRTDDAEAQKSVPDHCPVTLPTEPRYNPDLPYGAGKYRFWYGSDRLFVSLSEHGRWPRSNTLLLWFRKNRDWESDYPRPELKVRAERIDADGEPAVTVPVITESKGEHAAVMVIDVGIHKRGCWQISGNYKGDYLAFVVWVD
jgi:hypothetical protein